MKIESRSNSDAAGEAAPAQRTAPEEAVITLGKSLGGADVRHSKGVAVGKIQDPIRPGSGLLSVIGADERQRIRSTEASPFRMICALKIEAPWGEFVGTGWFAGPRTLVTAGHCVFDNANMGGWAEQITVVPGRDGDEPPAFGTYIATRFSCLEPWQTRRDPDFDVGAIHLDDPVGDSVGWFSVGALTDQELHDSLVNVSGYPARPGGGVQQWWAKNRIRAVTPRRIFYDVDTSGGQSGGPVYHYKDMDADPIVVGIHAYGTGGTPDEITLEVNSASRILPEVAEQVRKWADADASRATGAANSNAD